MAHPVVIDTDVLIDFGLDREDAVTSLAILEKNYQLTTSVISAMELYSGCRSKRDIKKVEELLTVCESSLCQYGSRNGLLG